MIFPELLLQAVKGDEMGRTIKKARKKVDRSKDFYS